MKMFGSMLVMGLITIAGWMSQSKSIQSADSRELVGKMGGACYACLGATEDPACKTGFLPACEQHTGFCVKYTFTGIKVDYCRDAAPGEGGTVGCRTDTPQVCVRIKTCSTCDKTAPCTNCGPESTEDKPTHCNLIPYAPCTGVAVAVDPVDPVNPAIGN